MKKQTFNLVIRALIGVAASLLIVGAMGLINESQNNQTLLEQASGVKADAVASAVDEITAREDCQGLFDAAGCGVHLLATAHAGSVEDFYCRPLYRDVARAELFDHILMLRPDRTARLERRRP